MEDEKKKKEAAEAEAVAAFVRKEVGDWDDEVMSRARFKALSGQRPDWEPLYHFWRDLIVKVARHLRIFIIRPSNVNRLWFRRAGLSPLCLDRVLVEMHRAGDLLLPHRDHPNQSRLRAVLGFFWGTGKDDSAPLAGDKYILAPLLEERALEIVNILSENYWTSSCVITMKKLEDICEGSDEAITIVDHLSAQGRAKLLTINKPDDPIQGVKVCLAPGAVSTASSVDYNVLHLIWTTEKLEQQLDLIDQRYQKSRNSALGCLKDGNKRVALKYAAEMKMASQSRERCTALLERVENVLQVITDAESSKKVSDAIQSSTHALKENQVSVEEVEACLQEVAVNIDSLKQLDIALQSTTAYAEIEDDDVEDEFNKLQLDITSEEEGQVPTKTGFDSSSSSSSTKRVAAEVSETADALSDALSNLHLQSAAAAAAAEECIKKPSPVPVGTNKSISKERILEAA
ncbi:hypothetical protein CASFOL_002665 [Castilleja foliolosa]|uniref:Charged multivesicular body protein 7 n=1 Tax=Castilleja foliolosa TaxID=1961234 RepID=A0ABD3EIV8_9LAMI